MGGETNDPGRTPLNATRAESERIHCLRIAWRPPARIYGARGVAACAKRQQSRADPSERFNTSEAANTCTGQRLESTLVSKAPAASRFHASRSGALGMPS